MLKKNKGKLAERSKAAVLKTVSSKDDVGSNPTLSDYNSILVALGMARGLIMQIDPNFYKQHFEIIDHIDRIVERVVYHLDA